MFSSLFYHCFALQRIRCEALSCLRLIAERVAYVKVFPFKARVTRELVDLLDDHKRVVRREAVKCRNEWLATNADE